jgi:FMN phosphatase YigB (HAD superfamily)
MKFVYFDIGGVLMRDLSDTNDGWGILLKSLGLKDNQRQEFDNFFEVLEKKLNLGEGIKEFVLKMETDFGIKLPKNYSISKDLVNRFFHKNEGVWQIVETVKNKYGIGLLTNMYDGMLDLIRKNNLIPNMEWIVIDSSVEKCKKPGERIYKIAEEKCGFKDKDILFIDNRQENLEIPKKMGWQTYWYDSSDYKKSNLKLAKFLR